MASSLANGAEGRPLKVLCCSGSLEGGGSERQLWQLAAKLDRRHCVASVYLLYRRGHYVEQLPSDVSVDAFWDQHHESRFYWPGQIRRLQIADATRVIRDRQIDVVYDRTFHMTLVTGAAARRASVPRVSVIVSPPSADFQKSRERFRYFKKWLLRAAYRQVGCVTVAVSDEVADDAATFYGLARSRVNVIPNPVDIDRVRESAGANCRATTSTQPRIAVVGRLSREKGQRLALEALRLANLDRKTPLEMDIVGDGPDRFELESLAAQLNVSQLVTFHGFLPNPYPLIQTAKLLCIPSEHEGLPNVALEAIAIGTGVVATDCSGSLRTLLGNNERGVIVPQRDAIALSHAFQSHANSTVWETRRVQAKQWIETHHALAPWLTKMESLFRSLC